MLLGVRSVLAAEPVLPGEPRIMREPGEVGDVIDAADGADPIDVQIALTYRLEIEQRQIERVSSAGVASAVGKFGSLTSRLLPEVRVGLFRDLAAVARLPIILSSIRTLEKADGASGAVSSGEETLFTLPFRSPERSGLDYFGAGIAWAPFNQARDRAHPTWALAFDVDVSVVDALGACNDRPPEGEVSCAAPNDRDRDGTVDSDAEPSAGSSRGTVRLTLTTSVARRIRYVEPFGLVRAALELPLADSPLSQASGPRPMPPIRAEAELGLGFLPWENRERFSRVWIDARLVGGFATRGADYSPLFDALGSSAAPSLRSESGGVYFDGVTTADAHATLGGSTAFAWRASELIKLGVSTAFRHELAHSITSDEACADGASSCSTQSPAYRPALDDERGQFAVAGSLLVEIAASGSVTF